MIEGDRSASWIYSPVNLLIIFCDWETDSGVTFSDTHHDCIRSERKNITEQINPTAKPELPAREPLMTQY